MRLRAILAALTLMLVSCSGDSAGPGRLPLGSTTLGDVTSAADTLVMRFGEQGGFFVAAAALDLGHSGEQVTSQAAAVDADGSIPGIEPDYEPSGLVEPFDGPQAMGAARSGWLGAPRVLLAGQEDQPQDAQVPFLDSTLGEMLGVVQARIAREQIYQDLEDVSDRSLPIVAILSLAATGYSPEQILEALLFDKWARFGSEGCTVIDDGTSVVTPRNPTRYAQILCRTPSGAALFAPTPTTTSASSSPTTTTGAGLVPGTGALDGVYTGTAEFVFAIPGWEVVTSEARAVIAGDDIEMTLVYEFRYDPRYINETPSCTAVVRDSWYGLGFVVTGLLELDLAPVSREILSLTGTDCDVAYSTGTARDEVMAEFASEVPYAVFGSVNDEGVLTGGFGDFLSFTATRG